MECFEKIMECFEKIMECSEKIMECSEKIMECFEKIMECSEKNNGMFCKFSVVSLMTSCLTSLSNIEWLTSWVKGRALAHNQEYSQAIQTYQGLNNAVSFH